MNEQNCHEILKCYIYLLSGILVLLSIGFLTPSFYYIPKASLAAVIISAVMFMIEYEAIPIMWRINSKRFIKLLINYSGNGWV